MPPEEDEEESVWTVRRVHRTMVEQSLPLPSILQCYQSSDPVTMRSALANRRALGVANNSDTHSDTPQAAHFSLTR
ncbi:MAG: hypothetical protein O7F70_04235 [Gemmatimonadetes bacterium]|nr:hypothetical protein [Gemmatimonadota bacterium]